MTVNFRHRPGFTLVEILVVLGIIVILAAILIPTANQMLVRARNAAIALEVSQLADAIETYKQEKGDYPPNFRDYQAFMRHVRKCYPKIDTAHLNAVVGTIWPGHTIVAPPPVGMIPTIDEGESLVFWLSRTDNDPRLPFKYIATKVPYPPPGSGVWDGTAPLAPANAKKYYDFDETRLVSDEPSGADTFYSYKARYCKDSYYLYIDSRSYVECAQFTSYGSPDPGDRYASAEEDLPSTNPPTSMAPTRPHNCARPYWTETFTPNAVNLTKARDKYKAVNATSFQLLCAGQDGDFGGLAIDLKLFPSGFLYDNSHADHDNITNFSNGRRLEDNLPKQ